MRNRIPHAIVMTILCILLVMPWLTGVIFKHKYYHLIDIINQDQRVKIDILDYQGGWLESTAKIRITLTGNEFGNLPQIKFAHPVTFDLDETMFHGPIIYDTNHKILEVGYAKILTTMHLSEATETELLGKLQSLGIMQIDVVSELDGDWRGHITIPVLALNIQDIGALSWAGLNGHFKLILSDDHIKRINVDMKIGTFTMKGDENSAIRNAAIEPSEYEYKSTHENVGLWSGNSNLHSNGLYFVAQDGSYFSATNFNFNTKFGVSGGILYNTNVSLNIGNIKATNNIIPMISDLHILVSADNFSAEDALSYVNYLNSTMPQAIKAVNKSTIESLLVHTIRTTSELYSEISMKTTLGPIIINSKSAWKENAPAPATFDDVTMNSTTVMNVNASAILVAELLQFINKKMHKPDQSSANANDPKNDAFNQQLALYLKQANISVNEFVAVVNLEKEKLSVTDFNEKLAQLNLPTNINSQLINLYGTYLSALPSEGGTLKKPPQTPQQVIHDLLRIGYIQKDKDGNYFTTLTIDGGLIKINDSVINLK